MRIGIDARELAGRVTGVGRYLAGLLREWERQGDTRQHTFILYGHEPIVVSAAAETVRQRVIPGAGGTWWEQRQLPPAIREDALDVFFAPAYTAPMWMATPLVVAIHDISYVAQPAWFTVREGARRRAITRHVAHAARAVVTISEFSREEIVERLGVPTGRVHVIPPGIDPPPVAGPTDAAGPNVLYVGSIFNRRHVPELVHAFGLLARRHPDARLDLVGDNRSHPRQDIAGLIEAEGLGTHVRWHAYVDETRRASLYGRARAFAFLSEYEGLGLPPLEALSIGIPPLLADTPVARETCGSAARYVGLSNYKEIVSGLEELLYDSAVRGRLLAAAPAVLGHYDWPRAARDTLALLAAAATPSHLT